MSKPPSLGDFLLDVARWVLAYFLPALVIVLLPFLPVMLGSPSPWGIPAAIVAAVLFIGAHAVSTPEYGITDMGPTERVDVTTFEGTIEACAACETSTKQGVYRRYRRQWVLAGIPLYTLEWGQNAYCPDCIDPDTLDVVEPASERDLETDGNDRTGRDRTDRELLSER